MKNQTELPLRATRKLCSFVRRTRRAQWAHLWFTRMHEVIEEAEDQIPTDKREQNQPFSQPGNAVKED